MSLRNSSNYNRSSQIGIIVDSDLSSLQDSNLRRAPIYDEFYLPGNVKFIYASSDIGGNAANKLLSYADKKSKRLLNYIVHERCSEG